MATRSSVLAWRIPWTGESSGLQSMGSPRVGHDWVTNTCVCTFPSSRQQVGSTPRLGWEVLTPTRLLHRPSLHGSVHHHLTSSVLALHRGYTRRKLLISQESKRENSTFWWRQASERTRPWLVLSLWPWRGMQERRPRKTRWQERKMIWAVAFGTDWRGESLGLGKAHYNNCILPL